jgi:hypothetical protein
MEKDDPGWPNLLIMFVPFWVNRRAKGAPESLTATRYLWLAFTYSLLLFGFVLWFIADGPGEVTTEATTAAYVVAGIGIAALIANRWGWNRPLRTMDEMALLASYRTNLFLAIAFAEAAALAGFVATFVSGEWWVYLVGLTFGLIGMARVAPTSGNLDRLDERVREQGSPLSVRRALLRGPAPGSE